MPESSVTATAIPDGSVVITPTEMYREIRDTRDAVNRLVNVVDPALTNIRHDVADHEIRIRAVEKRVWVACGIGAVIGGAVGVIAPFIQ